VRLTAGEKREVIRLVEGSELSVRQRLQELGVNRATFYAWYRRYRADGEAGLWPKALAARRYGKRIAPPIRPRVVDAALADPERSARELAWQLTDRTGHFLSQSSVYRILKAHDLITSPALRRDHSGRSLRASDHAPERALAERLHVPAGGRRGLVLPLDGPGRLLAVYPGVDAYNHDGRD
jgi:putative transposase